MEAEQEIPENGNKMKELANQLMDDETETTENGKRTKELANQWVDNETLTIEEGNRMKDLANQGMDDETVTDTVVRSGGKVVSSNKKAGSSSTTWRSRVPHKFVQDVWDMTDNEQLDSIICWSPSGASFIIKDKIAFEKMVLPMHFRSNFSSFNCQLNTYGFRKISLPGTWEFKNANFRRGEPDLLINIKRRGHIILRNMQQAPEIGRSPGTHNLEDEFRMLTEKHEQQKLEIIELKETQEKLKEKLAAVKMGLICSEQKMLSAAQELLEKQREVRNVEVAMTVDEGETSKEITKGKQKLQEEEISATSGAYIPAISSDFDSWCPPIYDEDEEQGQNNVFSSLEYLEAEWSEWTEYYRETQEKSRNVNIPSTQALHTGGNVKNMRGKFLQTTWLC